MKLLIVTQAVDLNHPVLGFFHNWIEKLAERFEYIEVVALSIGQHALPDNVRVHSLGKERKGGRELHLLNRMEYSIRFLILSWQLRRNYDAAFVHMNQEYILLTGSLWKFLKKPIYMWRNHYAGSVFTDIAAAFCAKVFCTSRHSYTAKYRKTVFMPVGVDTDRFHSDSNVPREKNSILFLGRMAPSKDPLMLLEALRKLKDRNIFFTATFVGSPLPEHEIYYQNLVSRAEQYGLSDTVSFLPAIPNHETPDLYRAHEIFVNCSPPGMLDKTIFEAAACGCLVLAASSDWARHVPEAYVLSGSPEDAAKKLRALLSHDPAELQSDSKHLQTLARTNSLERLSEAILKELT